MDKSCNAASPDFRGFSWLGEGGKSLFAYWTANKSCRATFPDSETAKRSKWRFEQVRTSVRLTSGTSLLARPTPRPWRHAWGITIFLDVSHKLKEREELPLNEVSTVFVTWNFALRKSWGETVQRSFHLVHLFVCCLFVPQTDRQSSVSFCLWCRLSVCRCVCHVVYCTVQSVLLSTSAVTTYA